MVTGCGLWGLRHSLWYIEEMEKDNKKVREILVFWDFLVKSSWDPPPPPIQTIFGGSGLTVASDYGQIGTAW